MVVSCAGPTRPRVWGVPEAKADVPTSIPQLPILNWEPRSDWISVKSAGAVGDGTTDDTAALQAAFALIKRGVTIYFPPGVYRVTHTLLVNSPDKHPLYGILVVGHGRDTRLVWDGANGEAIIKEEGMGYSRWVGLDLDGAYKAAIGQHHFSSYTFETVHRKQHMAFRNCTRAAVYSDPKDAFAIAETSFENSLFERCGTGVSFTKFNDYDITFDGCDFRKCGIGIECVHGNFYARNCHFEESVTADIISAPEHGSSIRRCTSFGSAMFLKHANPVAVITIEGCAVAAWKSLAGAISIAGAPGLVFDCAFTNPPPGGACAIRLDSDTQRLITSQNMVPTGLPLFNRETNTRSNVHLYGIPAGQRTGAALRPTQRFLKSTVQIPRRVFDAKRDFGALGDGKGDDTAAIQNAIDAARSYGRGAIAYLPSGRYIVRDTLRLSGKDYYFGGAGMLSTFLQWMGNEDGATVAVEDPDHITIEHIDLQKKTGVDILQTGTGRTSFVTYDGLFVSRSNAPPFAGGLRCKGLNDKCTVVIPCVVGTLHLLDCGAATIVVPLSYYGALIVEGQGRQRNGLLGILSRFSGGDYNVVLKDNQSIVMSDYYSESSGNIFLLEGRPEDPPGRVTVQGAKLHLDKTRATNVIEVRNYAGQMFLGPDQFNGAAAEGVALAAERRMDLFLLGNSFYVSPLRVTKRGAANVYRLGNVPVATINVPSAESAAMFADTLPPAQLGEIATGLDDLRRLGETDLRLNYPQGGQ
jgi:hypothetical protein